MSDWPEDFPRDMPRLPSGACMVVEYTFGELFPLAAWCRRLKAGLQTGSAGTLL